MTKAVMTDVPFAIDIDFYKSTNADLHSMSDAQALEHFRMYGYDEGRQASPLGCRGGLVDHVATKGKLLEIGPYCSPVVRGDNVRYLDVFDAEGLRARAASIGQDPASCPEIIHHVGDIADVDETFDAVVSSHSIEHQPDLIHHFKNVARILKPGTGQYFLIIPDKRYCFDHFFAESTIAEVIQAHTEQRRKHVLRSVIEHIALTTHNEVAEHWAGRHGERHPENQRERIKTAIDLHGSTDDYIDVHAWYFTPTSFYHIADALHTLGMTELKLTAIFPTIFNQLEFCAILTRD